MTTTTTRMSAHDEAAHGWNRLVRPMSVPTRGTVFLGVIDVALRRESVAVLWLAGIDVEEVCGLGVLCTRLVGAPFLGPLPDVVVWDVDLGPVAELDRVWRRYGEGPSPALVLVSSEGPWCEHGDVLVCRRDPTAILESVTRILGPHPQAAVERPAREQRQAG